MAHAPLLWRPKVANRQGHGLMARSARASHGSRHSRCTWRKALLRRRQLPGLRGSWHGLRGSWRSHQPTRQCIWRERLLRRRQSHGLRIHMTICERTGCSPDHRRKGREAAHGNAGDRAPDGILLPPPLPCPVPQVCDHLLLALIRRPHGGGNALFRHLHRLLLSVTTLLHGGSHVLELCLLYLLCTLHDLLKLLGILRALLLQHPSELIVPPLLDLSPFPAPGLSLPSLSLHLGLMRRSRLHQHPLLVPQLVLQPLHLRSVLKLDAGVLLPTLVGILGRLVECVIGLANCRTARCAGPQPLCHTATRNGREAGCLW
mmetsp:Transcript_125626/g.349861  ORF Transcript_125626/g.349861 Transcript_125626/m.349861 type:complete len:317 (-) Transcript_125626:1404-2354(-)